MKSKIIMLLLTGILLTDYAHATATTTPPSVPRNLHVYNSNGDTYVDLVADTCSGYRYHLSPNHGKYDVIVSILLAAELAGKQVVIRYDGCNGSSQGEIVGVYLP